MRANNSLPFIPFLLSLSKYHSSLDKFNILYNCLIDNESLFCNSLKILFFSSIESS